MSGALSFHNFYVGVRILRLRLRMTKLSSS